MAAAMPPDDVSALMTRVESDRLQYKVFEGRLGSRVESGTPSRVAFHPVATMHSRLNTAAAEAPVQYHDGARPRWNVLNSLLSVDRQDQTSPTPESLLVPMLTLSAGSGGVGKTTVLSTLARILSGAGESIFLVYSDVQRSLPLHFGGQQVVPGRVRTFIPPVRDNGQLHLYAHPEDADESHEEIGSWLPRQVNAFSSEAGRVLCEVTSPGSIERKTRELGTINLRVLVPDINSVLSVNRDLAEADAEQDSRTFYLLNKFDATVPFHKDVRDRLRAVLGERLLPFTIRRTDQVAEALASGTTVIDYAPNSAVADDFKLLAQWLRNSMPRNEIEPARRLL